MRILFLDQFSEPGGAQLCLCDLLPEVLRRGWEAELMAPGYGHLHEYCRQAGIPSCTLPVSDYSHGRKRLADVLRFPFEMVRAAASVGRKYRSFHPDVIYVNGPRVLPAAAGLACPIVFHSHSLLNRTYSRTIVDFCLRRSGAAVIATCRHVAQAIPGVPRVIYNGVADQGFVARPSASEKLHVGIIGRIAPEKGQLDFVLAAKLLAANHPKIRFSVTGASMFSDPQYEAAVRRAADGTGIEFRGWAGKVPELLHNLDMIAVPSGSVDATPRVVIEALSAGTPVVAYRSGGIEELLIDGETGILTASRTPEALAQAMGTLLASPETTARISTAGRREWEARFRLERYQRDVCDLLDSAGDAGARVKTLPASRAVPESAA